MYNAGSTAASSKTTKTACNELHPLEWRKLQVHELRDSFIFVVVVPGDHLTGANDIDRRGRRNLNQRSQLAGIQATKRGAYDTENSQEC